VNTTSIPKTAHTRPAAEVVRELDGDPEKGLTWAEAAARRERTGPNELPATRRRGPLARFALQFHSPLIYVLLAAALVTALLGDHVDAIVIMAVVLLNAFVGFVQESRAEQALAALVAMTRTVATVIRDGRRHRVPSTEIVTGDLVALEAGDKVPADLRLVEAADLRLDESALTGESTPVSKDPAPVGEVELADRRDMAYSGTFVTGGRGTGVVVAVGGATELGRIHRMVGRTPGVQTPLTRKIARFSRLVTVAILALAALTFLIGLARGQPVDEMLIAAVALAVGAIPEGLPAVVTITLALGVSRIRSPVSARRDAGGRTARRNAVDFPTNFGAIFQRGSDRDRKSRGPAGRRARPPRGARASGTSGLVPRRASGPPASVGWEGSRPRSPVDWARQR